MKGREELVDWNIRMGINKTANSAAAIKCYYGLNHYRQRNYKTNQKASIKECPRCSETEI